MKIRSAHPAGRPAAVVALMRQAHGVRTGTLVGHHLIDGCRRRTITGHRGRFGALRRSRGHRAFGRRLWHDHAPEGARP